MRQYASITLNMIAYAGIPEKTTSFPSEKMRWRRGCLKKQSAEYAIILNASNDVRSIRSLHKLLSIYRDREVF